MSTRSTRRLPAKGEPALATQLGAQALGGDGIAPWTPRVNASVRQNCMALLGQGSSDRRALLKVLSVVALARFPIVGRLLKSVVLLDPPSTSRKRGRDLHDPLRVRPRRRQQHPDRQPHRLLQPHRPALQAVRAGAGRGLPPDPVRQADRRLRSRLRGRPAPLPFTPPSP